MDSVLNALFFVSILVLVVGNSGNNKRHAKNKHAYGQAKKNCGQQRPKYPIELQNRNFTDDQGYGWTFGSSFSPWFDKLMYIPFGHTENFFLEFYVNDFSNSRCSINFSCWKYEIADNATVFVWVFEQVTRSYNDPDPDLCDICNGVVFRSNRLTDNASGLPVCRDPPPALTEHKVPENCRSRYDERY